MTFRLWRCFCQQPNSLKSFCQLFNHSYHSLSSFLHHSSVSVVSFHIIFVVSLFSFPLGIHYWHSSISGSFTNQTTISLLLIISSLSQNQIYFHKLIFVIDLTLWLYIHYTNSACKQHVSFLQNVQVHPISWVINS